ncbi:NAD(P)H-hydrate dehydratase [Halorubrum vacuolatum]|uniref:Bifunctional NAD(P)H-hydrate repair enzyme n=1 Tax=Halorubrum vacuolatum TaxID=63740 RepID=A0A238VEF8_HALVU|nr:NAD(P)H-hydrate dehydratase [Halorubrum vacuolatum]SNR32548.1 NAD(P)H-hydrate epimerase [Halorubrum vacuolatum]
MITSARMAAVDANAAALGVPQKQLMESSGNAVARAVREVADPGASVVIVCGRGNNGGDGFVAARFLSAYDVRVHLLGRPESIATGIARENWNALRAAAIPTTAITDATSFAIDEPDVIVDAMLGTGAAGALREPERTAASAINEARERGTTVVAVDVPSGVDADTGEPAGMEDETDTTSPATAADDSTECDSPIVVEADRIVTFHDEKPGLAALDTPVTVADIGIPEAAERFTGPGDLESLDRDPTSHKGDNGTVLVVGGGPYTGAPALTARAALRAGADLARVACPETIAGEVQGYAADLIVHPLPGESIADSHVETVLARAAEVDVVVLGPGMGDSAGTREFVGAFLARYAGRAVIDADALAVVPGIDTAADLICTPHQGELVGMGGRTHEDPDRRVDLVGAFAAEVGATMLVKGAVDVIAAHDGDDVRLNRTGNPGMTVGGTGDVLAGTVGAFAARLDPFEAAAVGAYVTGRAGDAAAEEYGNGLVATDLIDLIPHGMYIHE